MENTTRDYQHRQTFSLPSWFRQELPDIQKIKNMQVRFRDRSLATVCESAHCPNMGQCWGRGVATFMILGDTCTRACRFCAVNSGHPQAVCYDEPVKLAGIVRDLGLRYVVVTSVTRDDLEDEGAEQFVKIVHALRQENPGIKVELLIPDFSGKKILLERVVDAHPDVLGHNIEMAERLFPEIRPQADYRRSLNVLKMIRAMSFQMLVKSGFMVGLGETDEEVTEMMEDLHEAGCDMLTIGQYLSPSTGRRHVPVDRFVHPEVFDQYRKKALAMGFRHVFSAPLVRSSYIAEVGYQECCEK